jgi:hypothetical protein
MSAHQEPVQALAEVLGSADDVTRRRLLAGVGGAAAAGTLLARGTYAGDAEAASAGAVATASPGEAAFEAIAQIDQRGSSLTVSGYCTRVRGLRGRDLFTTSRGKKSNDPRSQNEGAARLLVFGELLITSVSTIDQIVIAVTATGTLGVRLAADGGADFATPASFDRGRLLAAYAIVAQDQLSVDGPQRASVQLTADLRQQSAVRQTFGDHRRRFGVTGQPLRLVASGRGVLTDPALPVSRLLVAGSFTRTGEPG